MEKKFTEEQLQELEKQLSCPSGNTGIEVGENMYASNSQMILNSMEFLELKNENWVLEIGPGNCGHLEQLMNSANAINYVGLEISETMLREAKSNNTNKQAQFKYYDGETIPFSINYFDRILSVNTIYFWSNPDKLITEIERTLKPNGVCVLSYANKDFMKNLPFVGQKFKLFDQNDIRQLVEKSNLKMVEIKELAEQVKSKTGEEVERKYTMVKLKKL